MHIPPEIAAGSASQSHSGANLPASAGVSLKHEHYKDVLAISGAANAPGFFEVHAENYMGAGGPAHYYLEKIRQDFALSVHGVGLSIGSLDALDAEHLERLRRLVRRYEPESFSEHLAWSSHGEQYYADLLPLPYDDVTLARVCQHVSQTQDALGRRILIENPSTYVEFTSSTMEEIDFLKELVARTGCGLLLDVNNVYVSCTNHNRSAAAYIDQFPVEHVGEIHLAGYALDEDANGDRLLIDAHGSAVFDPVWRLYEQTLDRAGPVSTLVEWDNYVPALSVLCAEAEKAQSLLDAEIRRRNRSAA